MDNIDLMDRNHWTSAWDLPEDSAYMLNYWETCVEGMDADLREQCHMEVCMGGLPENINEAFLARYLELHQQKYGEEYRI